jgi:transcriptional regulator with XRE-family HTH domain
MPLSLYDPRYALLRQELIQIRKTADLTQVALAAKLGVGQPLVSKIERGDAFMDVLFFVEWCKACNSHPSAIVERLANFEHHHLETVYSPHTTSPPTTQK